jgi:hypothetical protein
LRSVSRFGDHLLAPQNSDFEFDRSATRVIFQISAGTHATASIKPPSPTIQRLDPIATPPRPILALDTFPQTLPINAK